MELKFFYSKSAVDVHKGVISSTSSLHCNDILGLSFSRSFFSSYRGVVPNSTAYFVTPQCIVRPEISADPFVLGKISTYPSLPHVNGTNGVNPRLYSRDSRVLDSYDDEYGGVVVNPDRLPAEPEAFAPILHSSLSHWKIQGKKGVWLKLPLELSELVPIAVKEGFQYHHAERGHVMLTCWLPEGPCMLPANASHQVGVGGFVVNDKNEVLVVQERYCTPAFSSLWKLPTGFIQESEEIFDGAVREVKEETGVDTEFDEVIAFRHAHHIAFEKSDLFFICMLRPLSTQISVDNHEIQAAKVSFLVGPIAAFLLIYRVTTYTYVGLSQWMPLVEFVKQPLIKGDGMFKKVIGICLARLGRRYCGLFPHQVASKFDGKESTLYYNVLQAEDDSNCGTG